MPQLDFNLLFTTFYLVSIFFMLFYLFFNFFFLRRIFTNLFYRVCSQTLLLKKKDRLKLILTRLNKIVEGKKTHVIKVWVKL